MSNKSKGGIFNLRNRKDESRSETGDQTRSHGHAGYLSIHRA